MSALTISSDLRPAHREQIGALLEATASSPGEVDVALELLDLALGEPEQADYRFLLAEEPGADAVRPGLNRRLVGYVCYGPTPMTEGTYDLYWLVTHPDHKGRGLARALISTMEERLRAEGARLIRVETSSREASRRFYLAAGYEDVARFEDFYRRGDDLLVYTRRLDGKPNGRPVRWDFETIHDLAFSYRDFDRERDFLRACARRWGGGEPGRVLEWAGGASRHLESFADMGADCVGIDLSPEMTELARRRLGHLPNVRLESGDVRRGPVDPPVDLAFTMLSSIHVLATEADLVAHLETCAASLRPGGLYIIEATHPRDLTPSGNSETRWQQREGQGDIEGRFRLLLERREGPRVPAQLVLSLRRGGELRSYTHEQIWFIPDIAGWDRMLGQVGALECVARLGDLDLASRHDQPTAWRLVIVLRRRP